MNPAEIEATLPNGSELPDGIRSICEYHEKHGYPISGCFELSKIGMEDLKLWFPDDPNTYQQFMPFGRGACGDVYAIWLHDSRSPDDAPVVMFGSEGELEVLSENPQEFCRLLCLGYSEIGLEPFSDSPSEHDETSRFREFMIKRYGFDLPSTAEPIVERARECSPNFRDFVSRHQPG